MNIVYLLADIGGTFTRLSISKDGQTFLQPVEFPTPQNFNEAMQVFADKAQMLADGQKFTAGVVGLCGVLDKSRGQLVWSPNLPDWINKPVVDKWQKIIGAPVYIVNDAALAGLGEACHGAGQKYNIVAYLTISTGVGGAKIVNRKLDATVYGTEPGRQIIDGCGQINWRDKQPATLEDLVSGANVERHWGQKPELIEDKKVWEKVTRWLAYGLHNVVAMWSPEIIILGGPLAQRMDLEKLKQYVKEIVNFTPGLPEIMLADLGSDRAFYGALVVLAAEK